MKFARILAVSAALFVAFFVIAIGVAGASIASFTTGLPEIIKVSDYKPLMVSEVYARGGEKIGEFYREKRILTPYAKIPLKLQNAFVAAEDDTFWTHHGVNYVAIMRAFIVNLATGEKKQGASTITQQVAKTLLLQNNEKTYTRKIKEILLAQKMEENLSKQDIMYLYLNQIYFGEGAYGVAAASDTYFRKPLEKLTVAEMAMLAGLPKAPSDYSPTDNPQKAKQRQRYVLGRMKDLKQITDAEYKQATEEAITVYMNRESKPVAPHFIETLRQMLVPVVGEKALLDEGLKIYTGIDYKDQVAAGKSVQEGLRELDKREGWRGPLKTITDPKEQSKFLLATRKVLQSDTAPMRVIRPDGNFAPDAPLEVFHKRSGNQILTNIPPYIEKGQIVEGLVTNVDDTQGLVSVRFADGQGLIDIADMSWARRFDTSVNLKRAPRITKPSVALKNGDVILVKVQGEKFNRAGVAAKKGVKAKAGQAFEDYAYLMLEQRPSVEGALLSIDQHTGDVIAMVGGYEFVHKKNEFNRTVQARRQTGSAFKTIVYASALDRGYTPGTPVQDAPLVYEGEDEGQDEGKVWKPHNHEGKFEGDILFRKALIRSLNLPSVRILEDVGVNWATDYAHRLGIFSPLNQDLSLVLGSSSLTIYEMTKVFSEFGRLGTKVTPIIVKKVADRSGKVLAENISLDKRFDKEMSQAAAQLEARHQQNMNPPAFAKTLALPAGVQPGPPWTSPFYFQDPNQLIRPETAYLMTTILQGVVNEGTGGKARSLGRPVAGKTGSTNGYFDGWFIGYTPQVATGTWVGFDQEKSMGLGEVGGDTALPIWVDYMKIAHQDLPVEDFSVPQGVVFANIDGQTGGLASGSSANVVRQAFIDGTEPKTQSGSPASQDDTDFLKKDLTE